MFPFLPFIYLHRYMIEREMREQFDGGDSDGGGGSGSTP
jgi:hypothetical protein